MKNMPKIEKEIVVRNPQGLHARPAAIFVQTAAKYNAEISIAKDGEKVNGKSIMGILMLAAQKGSKVILVADGEDAEKAIQDLEALLEKDG